MWNKISNSLLFYSEEFYNNDLYKNRNFIKQIYFYYKNKGFKNILLTQIINILISIFLFILILFLFNCIDYKALLVITDYAKLSSFIYWEKLFKFNGFFLCLFISFILFIITKIINLVEMFFNYSKIKTYFNTNLNISEEKLEYIKWNDIINKLENYNNETIDIYKINSIILFYENYLNAIFDNKIIDLYHLTNLMEWNINYCILFKMFGEELELEADKKKNIYLRLRIVAIMNFIFMPFILVFMLFYNIFNYGEEFYNKPTLLTTRIFTKKAQWKYRYYNELQHDFDERLNKIDKPSKKYISQFKNDYTNSLSKLIVFICSSFFILLVVLTLINDKILIYVTIFNNKSILWFISILASLIAIFKRSQNKLVEPKIYMKEIANTLYLKHDFVDKSNNNEIKKLFIKDYQYKIIIIVKDIIYTILTPFRLWLLANNIDNIINFINANISDNEFNSCKIADFNSDLFLSLEEDNINKTIKSLKYFNELYPEWYTYMINKINGRTNEIRINVI
jgi:autophagy-related protein 9